MNELNFAGIMQLAALGGVLLTLWRLWDKVKAGVIEKVKAEAKMDSISEKLDGLENNLQKVKTAMYEMRDQNQQEHHELRERLITLEQSGCNPVKEKK